MINRKKYYNAIYKKRFTIFLMSILLLMFGNLLFPNNRQCIIETTFLSQNMIMGYLLFLDSSKIKKNIMLITISIGILLKVIDQFTEENLSAYFLFAYVLFFGFSTVKLFRYLKKHDHVDIESISAVFSGFLLIGFVFALAFISIDKGNESAFISNVHYLGFSDFLYFSFVTLLTIGYGDISPSTELTKKMVLILGLIGHFYTVFVTAIIVGKYMAVIGEKKTKSSDQNDHLI